MPSTHPGPKPRRAAKRARVDPDLASAFRVDWLEDLTRNEREDVERAVAEKAGVVVKSARHAREIYEDTGAEIEIKVWLETGIAPACVTVHWEARLGKHYALVMDPTGRERLAALVFERLPTVTGAEAEAETRLFIETFQSVVATRGEMEMMDFIGALQSEYKAMAKSD